VVFVSDNTVTDCKQPVRLNSKKLKNGESIVFGSIGSIQLDRERISAVYFMLSRISRFAVATITIQSHTVYED